MSSSYCLVVLMFCASPCILDLIEIVQPMEDAVKQYVIMK